MRGEGATTGLAQHINRLDEIQRGIDRRLIFFFSADELLTSTTRGVDHVSNAAAIAATRRTISPETATAAEPPARPPAPPVDAGMPRAPVDTNSHNQR